MGKKVKKKAKSGHREKRVVASSPKAVPQQSSTIFESINDGASSVKERKICTHLEKNLDLLIVSSKIGSLGPLKCEDCREESYDRRGKAKGKHGKKKGGGSLDTKSESKAIWVCLQCGHFSCGGAGFPTTPQSHAVRHARQHRHPLALQLENPRLRWCFTCCTLIPIENSEENGQPKDVLSDIVKMIKARPSEGASIDVEDVWFGSRSVTSEIKSEFTAIDNLDGGGGYAVKGLVNLGNTCFFNSILQNLLAMAKLRDHFLKLDGSIGPLTVSLKKLFVETSPEAGSVSVINPRSFFGCLCARAPQFKGNQQHDSHELLRCLLDGLCIEESSARKQEKFSNEDEMSTNPAPTFVDAIFGGKLSSTVSCLECAHASTVYEPFLDLSLPVPTKRPPSKKTQLLSRAKKSKIPSKLSQRIGSKDNRGAVPVSSQGVTDLSTGGKASSHVESSLPGSVNMRASSVNFTSLESVSQTIVDDNKVSASQNLSSIQVFENKILTENVTEETAVSVDDSTWMDFLEPDTMSLTNDTGNRNAFQNDMSLRNTLESSEQDHSNCVEQTEPISSNLAWRDYLEPSSDPGMASEINEISVIQGSIVRDAVPNDLFSGQSSETDCQVLAKESTLKAGYHGNSLENEVPLQVQDFEVLLLPYKEDALTTGDILKGGGVTVSPVCSEQDSLDFDGFGDLFNEPEAAAGLTVNVNPALSGSVSSNGVAETGFTAGNSSGSDPDEVDNTDSPVSVESCLAYFIKPEFLSRTEHAWHCENCSKALQEKRMSRKKRQTRFKVSINVGERIIGDGGNRNLSNGDNKRDVLDISAERLVIRNGNLSGKHNCIFESNTIAQQEPVASRFEGESDKIDALPKLTCSQGRSSCEYNDSCSVNEPGSAGCNSNAQHEEPQFVAGEHESDGSEDEKMDSESIKVKRDAMKRILIDEAPPILTIHLKRFSQDAHGCLSKLNGHVNFRDTFDLRPYMHPRHTEQEKYKYCLLGVVVHSGTMRRGHYEAYFRGGAKSRGKSEKDNGDSMWYHASDAQLQEVSLDDVLRREAYILFYERI